MTKFISLSKQIENVFYAITEILCVKPDEKIFIYLCPSACFCQKHKIPAPAAIPHAYFMTLIYNDINATVENSQIIHELTHMIAYFWDRKVYHLEILEEGLAMVLSFKNIDLHLMYKNTFSKTVLKENEIKKLLNVESHRFKINYKKAGSFAKYIIDHYGLNSFKKLYIESNLDCNKLIYYHNGKKLKQDHLKYLILKILEVDPLDLIVDWLSILGLKIL